MVALELFEDPFGLLHAQPFTDGVVVIECQVPCRILVGRHPEFVRVLGHWCVLAEVKGPEPDRVHELVVLFEKPNRVESVFPGLAGEAEEAHDVVPDPRLRRQPEAAASFQTDASSRLFSNRMWVVHTTLRSLSTSFRVSFRNKAGG